MESPWPWYSQNMASTGLFGLIAVDLKRSIRNLKLTGSAVDLTGRVRIWRRSNSKSLVAHLNRVVNNDNQVMIYHIWLL